MLLAALTTLSSLALISIWLSRLAFPLTREEIRSLRFDESAEYRAATQRLAHSVDGPIVQGLKVIEPFYPQLNPLVSAEFFVVGEARELKAGSPLVMQYQIRPQEGLPELKVRWLRVGGMVGVPTLFVLLSIVLTYPGNLGLAFSGEPVTSDLLTLAIQETPEGSLAAEIRSLGNYRQVLDRRAQALLVLGLFTAALGGPLLYLVLPTYTGGGTGQWNILPYLTLVGFVQGVALAILNLYRKAVADVGQCQVQRHRFLGLLAALKLAGSAPEGLEERLSSLAQALNAGSAQRAAPGKEAGSAGSPDSALNSLLKAVQKRTPE